MPNIILNIQGVLRSGSQGSACHKSIVAATQRIQTRQIRMRVHTRRQSTRQNRIRILGHKFALLSLLERRQSAHCAPNKQTGNQHRPSQSPFVFSHHSTLFRIITPRLIDNHNPKSAQSPSILLFTAASMTIGVPHSRVVSPGHLLVASKPIFEPSPDTGEAKSR